MKEGTDSFESPPTHPLFWFGNGFICSARVLLFFSTLLHTCIVFPEVALRKRSLRGYPLASYNDCDDLCHAYSSGESSFVALLREE